MNIRPEPADNLERDLKLFKVIMHMLTQTDSEHPETLTEIASGFVQDYPNMTNRFVMKCIHIMRELGFHVTEVKDGHAYLFYSETAFSFWVYQTLFTLIESAKFLSRETSELLVDAICMIAPKDTREKLNQISFYQNTSKTSNNETARSIATISEALLKNKKIVFLYVKPDPYSNNLNTLKEILAEPIALVPDSDKLYLICLPSYIDYTKDPGKAPFKFRIENLYSVKMTEQEISDIAIRKRNNVTSDYNGTFKMFQGKSCPDLVLQFPASFLRSIYDYFGENIHLRRFVCEDSEVLFQATVSAHINTYFFWWVLESGGKMQIISPDWVKEKMIEHLHKYHLRFDDTFPSAGDTSSLAHEYPHTKAQSEAATPDCRKSEQK